MVLFFFTVCFSLAVCGRANVSDVIGFGQRAYELHLVVYHYLRDAADPVAPREVWELLGFDDIGSHARAFDCELVGQPGRRRAVRSGRRRKDFYVYVFGERGEEGARFIRQVCSPRRRVDQVGDKA